MNKALILSSGGIDSTTCLAIALDHFKKEDISTVSFKYGQKHDKELESAKKIAKYYRVKHHEIDLTNTGIFDTSNCSLLKSSTQELKKECYKKQIQEEGIVNSYVPFRNGLMVSSAASLALSINPDSKTFIYCGAHADDAAGNAYADCSIEFMEYLDKAIFAGTYKKVELNYPLINDNKSQVVGKGLERKAPYHLTWSCYEGGEKACGKCATCIDRLKAFKDNTQLDPIEYE